MAKPAPSPKAATVALAWLGNPVVIWGVGLTLAALALMWLVPGLYNKGKEGVKKVFGDAQSGFSGAVDGIRSQASYFIGQPATNELGKRDDNDTFQGLFVENDRALSDVWDKVTGWM